MLLTRGKSHQKTHFSVNVGPKVCKLKCKISILLKFSANFVLIFFSFKIYPFKNEKNELQVLFVSSE